MGSPVGAAEGCDLLILAVLLLQQRRTSRFKRLMLILVQRIRQLDIEFLALRGNCLRRQQRHFAILQQLENPFDLERGRPTGEFTFLAALLDRDTVDGVLTDKRSDLGCEHFDVGGFVVIVQGNFLGGERDMAQRLAVQRGHGDDRFAAFDFDAADFHVESLYWLKRAAYSSS